MCPRFNAEPEPGLKGNQAQYQITRLPATHLVRLPAGPSPIPVWARWGQAAPKQVRSLAARADPMAPLVGPAGGARGALPAQVLQLRVPGYSCSFEELRRAVSRRNSTVRCARPLHYANQDVRPRVSCSEHCWEQALQRVDVQTGPRGAGLPADCHQYFRRLRTNRSLPGGRSGPLQSAR